MGLFRLFHHRTAIFRDDAASASWTLSWLRAHGAMSKPHVWRGGRSFSRSWTRSMLSSRRRNA